MSHPINKRERFLIGYYHGIRRAGGYFHRDSTFKKSDFRSQAEQARRNTTKCCSCCLCGNPRRKYWKDKLTMQEKRFKDYAGEAGEKPVCAGAD